MTKPEAEAFVRRAARFAIFGRSPKAALRPLAPQLTQAAVRVYSVEHFFDPVRRYYGERTWRLRAFRQIVGDIRRAERLRRGAERLRREESHA